MWKDISDIKKKFGLDENLDELSVRSELRKLLLKVHPDTTKGSFIDSTQKTEYERIISALDFLKNDVAVFSSRDLINIVEQQNAIITQTISNNNELIVAAITKQQEASLDAARLERTNKLTELARTSLREQSVKRHRPMTISGVSLAGIAALLLAFKGPLEELGKAPIFNSIPYGNFIIPAALIYFGVFAAIFAFISNIREQQEIEKREYVLTEGGFRKFLFSKQFLEALDWLHEDEESFTIISLANINDAVTQFANLRGTSVAQTISDVFYHRLIDRQLATVAIGSFLSPTLKLSDGLANEIRYGDHPRSADLNSSDVG